MASLCLCCGADLDEQKPIEYGGVKFDSYGDITFKGVLLDLSAYERRVLGAIVKAEGQFVNAEAIKNILYGEEKAETVNSNVIQVLVCRIRKKMREIDPSQRWIVGDDKRGGWWSQGERSGRGYRLIA